MNTITKETNDKLQKIKDCLKPYILKIIEQDGAEGKKKFYEELYNQLKVKHGINVYRRKTDAVDKSKALMDYVRESEYKILMNEICTLLYEYKVVS